MIEQKDSEPVRLDDEEISQSSFLPQRCFLTSLFVEHYVLDYLIFSLASSDCFSLTVLQHFSYTLLTMYSGMLDNRELLGKANSFF